MSPTTTDVLDGIDLTGRTVVITGASTGLGLQTARVLQGAGATIVAAVRDVDKTREAIDCETVVLELGDLRSARAAAEHIAARHDRIDVLINNAGVMAPPLARTAQGYEMQLGTNHLGHFVLTTGLVDRFGEGTRIVNLSSRGHQLSGIRWDDPNYDDESVYDKWQAYGQSKTANVLFTVEAQRRWGARGVHSFAVHPGVVYTDLARHMTRDDFSEGGTLANLEVTDVAHGAATTVWAATSPELDRLGGCYLEDCGVADPMVDGSEGGYAAWAVDPEQAARLWEWSQRQAELNLDG
ncbi:NAD(P)-dependent dehydrogenase (short-subunit alcohol dehydrogenase family) [Mycolicibacterium sp. BK556]|uniref:SDR family NAD(P)-dependent oxidoreductase n=1 Tax=unclassified Mycolicibacterium TaxID=2636767 RepID=UPI0017C800E6|nr:MULTISPECIES: SDR family NAD(P)-dependent oxidoreductase [unclassified Mycolicibacterium]MBB3600897.1 NAD(P)-dependent dehydrogenase (short-subunit alcohol dehydrogenase family) [Mycolicibacterium sp. BK556]MBB3630651.1 NAD(P)-dependent dehydrogenase (short-subunit alcohol dehydrogenase family) [Mycolicibacterium sp. BK607]MBB3748645.1 NAD(P)-dependent dehydrogenase (short-subunit alcohol dehydrogenase family) [Mycolicibacterium sp. BK634]